MVRRVFPHQQTLFCVLIIVTSSLFIGCSCLADKYRLSNYYCAKDGKQFLNHIKQGTGNVVHFSKGDMSGSEVVRILLFYAGKGQFNFTLLLYKGSDVDISCADQILKELYCDRERKPNDPRIFRVCSSNCDSFRITCETRDSGNFFYSHVEESADARLLMFNTHVFTTHMGKCEKFEVFFDDARYVLSNHDDKKDGEWCYSSTLLWLWILLGILGGLIVGSFIVGIFYKRWTLKQMRQKPSPMPSQPRPPPTEHQSIWQRAAQFLVIRRRAKNKQKETSTAEQPSFFARMLKRSSAAGSTSLAKTGIFVPTSVIGEQAAAPHGVATTGLYAPPFTSGGGARAGTGVSKPASRGSSPSNGTTGASKPKSRGLSPSGGTTGASKPTSCGSSPSNGTTGASKPTARGPSTGTTGASKPTSRGPSPSTGTTDGSKPTSRGPSPSIGTPGASRPTSRGSSPSTGVSTPSAGTGVSKPTSRGFRGATVTGPTYLGSAPQGFVPSAYY